MSLKESQSRVTNTKEYDKNFDEIFNKDKPKEKKHTRTKVVVDETWGRATRYYYS